jgi:hypothetical protein
MHHNDRRPYTIRRKNVRDEPPLTHTELAGLPSAIS